MKKQFLSFLLLTSVSLFSFSDTLHAQANTASPTLEQSQKSEVTHRLVWGAKVSPYVRKVIVTLDEKKNTL